MCKKVVCFDLDDTLYKEIDFLKSGYKKVAELIEKRFGIDAKEVYCHLLAWYYNGDNAFACVNDKYGLDNPMEDYLNVYRYHQPTLALSEDTRETIIKLKEAGVVLGIITDGRELTQRRKIEALGLEEWIPLDMVMINEDKKYFKPNHWSYDKLMLKCLENGVETDAAFYYVGDNPEKDFLAPNELGWTTICLLNDGRNIHKQDFSMQDINLPKFKVESISEILGVI